MIKNLNNGLYYNSFLREWGKAKDATKYSLDEAKVKLRKLPDGIYTLQKLIIIGEMYDT